MESNEYYVVSNEYMNKKIAKALYDGAKRVIDAFVDCVQDIIDEDFGGEVSSETAAFLRELACCVVDMYDEAEDFKNDNDL